MALPMFGVSVRSFQYIEDAEWYLPDRNITAHQSTDAKKRPRVQNLQLNDTYNAFHSPMIEELCSASTTGSILLVEDDTMVCPGAWPHLLWIANHVQSLEDKDPLVYVRVSFGMNGLLLNCRRIQVMRDALQAAKEVILRTGHRNVVAIDWFTADYMNAIPGAVLVYAYSLFMHRGHRSTIWTQKSEQRRRWLVPGCFEHLANSLVPHEGADQKCTAAGFAFTPCPIEEDDKQTGTRAVRRRVNVRLGASQPATVVTVARRGRGCANACGELAPRGRWVCDLRALVLLNARMLANHEVPSVNTPRVPRMAESFLAMKTYNLANAACTDTQICHGWDGSAVPHIEGSTCYGIADELVTCDAVPLPFGSDKNAICKCH
jgi:hypothetical protein